MMMMIEYHSQQQQRELDQIYDFFQKSLLSLSLSLTHTKLPTIGTSDNLQYEHLAELPFLTRCVTETLRMWPAVVNGSFRQLQFDDTVKGPGGKQVELKKGTYVQIPAWPRHRNPKLWGEVRYSSCPPPPTPHPSFAHCAPAND